MPEGAGGHRIGEFARRVGVSPDLLRAWEHRYGLLDPIRSPGGYRLYGDDDALRVARMRQALGEGLSAAQAAQAALQDQGGAAAGSAAGPIEAGRAELLNAIDRFDEAAVQAALDDCLAAFGLETFVSDLVLPTLAEVGRRWESGEVDISREHFASNLIRGRLLSLARLWGRGTGKLALLACAPGERHDISLIAFGLVLRSYGWRILFLGADTPLETLLQAAEMTRPAATVIAVFDHDLLTREARKLDQLAQSTPVFLSGPGATAAAETHDTLHLLEGPVVQAATRLVGRLRS